MRTGRRLRDALKEWDRTGRPIPEDLRPLARKIVGDGKVLRVADVLDDYLAAKEKSESVADLRHDAEFWKCRIGKEVVTGLDRQGIRRLVNKIQDTLKELGRRHSPWTVIHRRTTLCAAFNFAEKERIRIEVHENPFHYRIRRASVEGRHVNLRYQEFVLIVRSCPVVVRPVLIFLACTGRRIGEAVHLLWREVKLEESKYYCEPEKRGRAGWFDLRGFALDVVRNQPRVVGEQRMFPLSAGYVSHCFTRAVRKLHKGGLLDTDDVHLHDLRHAAATWLNSGGATQRDLQEFFAWRSPEMAMRYPTPIRDEVAAKGDIITAGLESAGLSAADFNLISHPSVDPRGSDWADSARKTVPKTVPEKVDVVGQPA